MPHSFSALFLLLAIPATVAGCNPTTCGPGSKRVQAANGDVQCVVADVPATGNVPCDVDGGTAVIEDGVCTSHVMCDPATTRYDPTSGLCIGNGMSGGCPSCPSNPGAGKTCVSGHVIDFGAGQYVAAGARMLRVSAYDPLAFLGNPSGTTPLQSTTDDTGCFAFTVPPPASGLIAIAVDDPSGAAPALALGATGAPIVAGKSYQIDAYLVERSLLDGWAAINPAYASAGAYVGCFYKDAPGSADHVTFTEKVPLAGVQLLENSAVPSPVNYLAADRTIDAALTATGALGCAITDGNGGVDQFSGVGGGVTKWETQPGAGTAPAVFVTRFHDCDGTTGKAFCF